MEEKYKTIREKPSKIWYLLPIFLGPIGGIIGYFLVKDRDKKFAERLLIVGVIMIVIGFVLSFIITFIVAFYAMGIFSVTPSIPCSPCFTYFAYVDHGGGQLLLRNGFRDITITSVSVGNLLNGPNFTPGETIIIGIPTHGDVRITINYQDVTSGSPFVDNAVIHNPES